MQKILKNSCSLEKSQAGWCWLNHAEYDFNQNRFINSPYPWSFLKHSKQQFDGFLQCPYKPHGTIIT